MAKLAAKADAETILMFKGAVRTKRIGLSSLAGLFDNCTDAELAAAHLKDEGYRAHALADLNDGTGICIVGIHG